jgi:hypothetical protein
MENDLINLLNSMDTKERTPIDERDTLRNNHKLLEDLIEDYAQVHQRIKFLATSLRGWNNTYKEVLSLEPTVYGNDIRPQVASISNLFDTLQNETCDEVYIKHCYELYNHMLSIL